MKVAGIHKDRSVVYTMMTISLIFACYIAITYGFAIDLFSMVVSDMRLEIGFNYTVVGTISACARGGFLLASLMCVFMMPLIGTGRLVFSSVVVCTTCLWAMGFSANRWMVGGGMILIGACAATVYIPMVEIVGRFIRKEYHGRVIGFICGGQSAGVMAASMIVPYFVTHHTWRWAWFTVGLIATVALIVSWGFLSRIGVFQRHRDKVKNESAIPDPHTDGHRSILNTGTVLILILYFFSAFSFNPFQTYLSPYFREELGFPVETATMVWTWIAIPGLVAGLVMGYAADRFGICFSLVTAYTATLVATLILIYLPEGYYLVIIGLLFGIAFYSIFGLIPAYISKVNTPKTAAKVFALANILHGAGGISGNFLGGWLKDVTGSFQWLYCLIAVALTLLILITFFLPGERNAAVRSKQFETL